MIESIYQIGRAIMEDSSGKRAFLESLAVEPPSEKDEKPKIAIVKFDTESKGIDVELRELNADDEARYLWLGNAATNSDQDRLTTKSLHYLLTQAVPTLLEKIELETDLHNALTKVFEHFYADLGSKEQVGATDTNYKRFRYFLSPTFLDSQEITYNSIQAMVKEQRKADGVPNQIVKAFNERYEQQLGKEKMLYTIEVDGKFLIDSPAYHNYLEDVYVTEVFQKAKQGRCYLTAKEGKVTADLKHLKFKYYIRDKKGFASGAVEKGFEANLRLCKDAYTALLAGERFVQRELGFRLAGVNGFMIPSFYFQEVPASSIKEMEQVSTTLTRQTRSNLGLPIQGKIDETIADEIENQSGSLDGSYSLNLLFFKWVNQGFKVIRLIQDVPDYRLGELRKQGESTQKLGNYLFGESTSWDLTVQKMYFLLPVRVTKESSGKKTYHSRDVLEFYATLITGGLVNARQLIQDFMELVRVYRFSNYVSYHVSEPEDDSDYPLIRYTAQSIMLLAFLRAQRQLKEEDVSLSYLDDLDLENEQQEYLQKLHFSRDQTALYLLGLLVGEIANAQYRLGEGGKGGKKVILNKLNYQGMTINKVQRLATDLFDTLRQYRIRSKKDGKIYPLLNARNEKIFAQAQELLSQGIGNGWTLTPDQNTYYILSGYTHKTFQVLTNIPGGEDDNSDESQFHEEGDSQ